MAHMEIRWPVSYIASWPETKSRSQRIDEMNNKSIRIDHFAIVI